MYNWIPEGQRSVSTQLQQTIPESTDLQTDHSGGQRRGRGNGRNDLSSNLLGRVSGRRRNTVCDGSQVRGAGDLGDVEVGIVVLFEGDRSQPETGHVAWLGQLDQYLVEVGIAACSR